MSSPSESVNGYVPGVPKGPPAKYTPSGDTLSLDMLRLNVTKWVSENAGENHPGGMPNVWATSEVPKNKNGRAVKSDDPGPTLCTSMANVFRPSTKAEFGSKMT